MILGVTGRLYSVEYIVTVNDELKKMWKEVVMDYFNALSWHLPGRTEEIYKKNLNQDCQGVGQDLNQASPEYKS
jgi:hypothetical protein